MVGEKARSNHKRKGDGFFTPIINTVTTLIKVPRSPVVKLQLQALKTLTFLLKLLARQGKDAA